MPETVANNFNIYSVYHHTVYVLKNGLASQQVGPKTGAGNLHCLCTHLSAFGGDLFVAPNPIDFDKVWAEFGNLAESGNFVVLATVCSIFGLYFIGLVFARKADKKDETKVGIFSSFKVKVKFVLVQNMSHRRIS